MYTKYVSSEHIVVYSIDEVFIDASPYLTTYRCSAHELARRIIRDVLSTTGITATAGIGTNLYLSKVAMDIVAKHIPADAEGVRIAELDEMSYRRMLWNHRPLTDFWRVGKGCVRKLEQHGLYTMGDIARRSVQNEESLYRMFGKNAELLIDHARATIYRPGALISAGIRAQGIPYKLPFCEFSEMPELKNKIHLGVVAWILLHAIFRSGQLIQS